MRVVVTGATGKVGRGVPATLLDGFAGGAGASTPPLQPRTMGRTVTLIDPTPEPPRGAS